MQLCGDIYIRKWHETGEAPLFFSRSYVENQYVNSVAQRALHNFQNILLQMWSTAKAGRLRGIRVELFEELASHTAVELDSLQRRLGDQATFPNHQHAHHIDTLVEDEALVEIGQLVESLEADTEIHSSILREEHSSRQSAQEWLSRLQDVKRRASKLMACVRNSPQSRNAQKVGALAADIYGRAEKCEFDATGFLVRSW